MILISLFILLLISYLSKITTRRYFSIAAIFPFQWFILIMFAYLINYRYIEYASFYIVLFSLLYFVGYHSFRFNNSTLLLEKNIKFNESFFSFYLILSQIIALLGSIIYFYIVVTKAGSLTNFLIAGAIIRDDLLNKSFSIPLLVRVMSYLSIPNLILAIIFNLQFKKKKRFIICSIIPILLVSIAGMGRLNIILALIFSFWTIYYGKVLFSNIRIKHIEKKLVTLLILFSFLIITSFGLIQKLRIGDNAKVKNTFTLVERIPLYAVGSISAFGKFIERNENDDLLLGQKTFSGIFDILNIKERKAGLYKDWVKIASNGEKSNVFTAFRIFLEDFGLLGFIIIAYLLGISICQLERKIVREKNVLYFSNLIYLLTIITCFFVTSLTVYNSILFGIFYLNLFIYFQHKNSCNERMLKIA